MTKKHEYIILSKDHVVEAITRYLRDTPFRVDFETLDVEFFDDNAEFDDGVSNLVAEVRLSNER